MINLTFSDNFLNTRLNIIKSITEKNNLFCQDFKSVSNLTFIFNADLFKQTDGNNIFNTDKLLKLFWLIK